MVDELTKLGPFQLGGDVSSKLYRKTFSATPLQRRCDERRNAMAHTSPSRRIRRWTCPRTARKGCRSWRCIPTLQDRP